MKQRYGAAGDGMHDDTAALQKALDENSGTNAIIYLPNGTYLVSDTLRWARPWQFTIMQGQSTNGTVIRLKDSCPGFQNPEKRKGVIWTGDKPAQRFRNAIRNVTVNTGSGNPGVSGIQFHSNNQGCMRSVRIVSEDGQGACGLDLAFTDEIGPHFIKYLHVSGFDIGIKSGYFGNSTTFEHVLLENQNVCAFENDGNVVSVRKLTSRNRVPVFRNLRTISSMVLLNTHCEWCSDADATPVDAVDNEGTLYARDVSCPGYQTAINNTGGHGKSPSGDSVNEFISHDTLSLFPSSGKPKNLPVEETPEIDWDPLDQWANILDYCDKDNPPSDYTDAFQQAIDSGKSTVYIPHGTNFCISREIFIRGNVKRIIGCEGQLHGTGRFVLIDGNSPVVVIERFRNDFFSRPDICQNSSRTLVVSSVSLEGGQIEHCSSGKLFVEDFVGGLGPISSSEARIWARQLNTEAPWRINVANAGAKLWVFGYKTETNHIKILTTAGGITEVLGTHNYSNRQEQSWPFFHCIDSTLLVYCYKESNFINVPYEEYIRETRYGETKVLMRADAQDGGDGSGRSIAFYRSGSAKQ